MFKCNNDIYKQYVTIKPKPDQTSSRTYQIGMVKRKYLRQGWDIE